MGAAGSTLNSYENSIALHELNLPPCGADLLSPEQAHQELIRLRLELKKIYDKDAFVERKGKNKWRRGSFGQISVADDFWEKMERDNRINNTDDGGGGGERISRRDDGIKGSLESVGKDFLAGVHTPNSDLNGGQSNGKPDNNNNTVDFTVDNLEFQLSKMNADLTFILSNEDQAKQKNKAVSHNQAKKEDEHDEGDEESARQREEKRLLLQTKSLPHMQSSSDPKQPHASSLPLKKTNPLQTTLEITPGSTGIGSLGPPLHNSQPTYAQQNITPSSNSNIETTSSSATSPMALDSLESPQSNSNLTKEQINTANLIKKAKTLGERLGEESDRTNNNCKVISPKTVTTTTMVNGVAVTTTTAVPQRAGSKTMRRSFVLDAGLTLVDSDEEEDNDE